MGLISEKSLEVKVFIPIVFMNFRGNQTDNGFFFLLFCFSFCLIRLWACGISICLLGAFRSFWKSLVGYFEFSNIISLGDFFQFISSVGLLCHFFSIVKLKRVLGWGLFNRACNVGGCIIRGGWGAWRQTAGVVHILCSPKCRGGLNPCQVKSLIPHLEAVCSTYPRDLGPEGFLDLRYLYVVAFLFGLVLGLLSILQLGMAIGRVWTGFLYAWTRPASLYLLLEPGPFNKRVFLFAPRLAQLGPVGLV